MTSKPVPRTPPAAPAGQFPDFPRIPSAAPAGEFPVFPPRADMQNPIHLHAPAHQAALYRHFGAPATTIVLGEVPVGWNTSQRRGLRIPDLLIAFNVDRSGIIEQQGYSIEEHGKPPDFVLEIASPTTARNDYTVKRNDYSAYGIPEFWSFDPTGGRLYETGLAGDRLVDGAYQPVSIVRVDETHYWGHSTVLGLDVCWEDGQLRWYDPAAQRYLRTFDEEADDRIVAEERVRELEAELRRLQGL